MNTDVTITILKNGNIQVKSSYLILHYQVVPLLNKHKFCDAKIEIGSETRSIIFRPSKKWNVTLLKQELTKRTTSFSIEEA